MSERDFACDDGYDDDGVVCPRCMGERTVNCYCAGDFCICANFGDADCPVCHAEGYVSQEREGRYLANLAKQREMLREIMDRAHPATKGAANE